MQYSKLKTKQEDRRNTAQTEEMYGAQNANNSILMYHRVQNMGVDFDRRQLTKMHDAHNGSINAAKFSKDARNPKKQDKFTEK